MNKNYFKFGDNWSKFLLNLQDYQVEAAINSVRELTGKSDLSGFILLDLGAGSGLFSLAARKLGASVISVDYDGDCISCCEGLKAKFYGGDLNWKVVQGSILDSNFMQSFAGADIVYSWGVLHHTGKMWEAIRSACGKVNQGGCLVISIYNTHWSSPIWYYIKLIYNRVPSFVQKVILYIMFVIIFLAKFIVTRKNPLLKERGMNFWYDVVDWVGGFPYEYATESQIVEFITSEGFELIKYLKPSVPTGCNEFVFKRIS